MDKYEISFHPLLVLEQPLQGLKKGKAGLTVMLETGEENT
jgi:hypothetical protein